ncbi:hypothetical protein Tsubulata_040627, partial [Turnera subulata]
LTCFQVYLQRIPDKFVRLFGHELSGVVNVKVPNCQAWKVGLTRNQDGLWFNRGFREFMEHLSLDFGHFLVFRYEGSSSFSVFVFDKTACEIRYPSNLRNFSENIGAEDSEAENDGKIPDCEESEIIVSGFIDPSEETKQAFKAATLLKPQNPYFILVVRPSHIDKRCMRVPTGFTVKYLSHASEYVILGTTDGREWQVRSIWQKPCRNLLLSKGWSNFVTENDLEEGDVCVLELIDDNNPAHPVLKVTMFRAIEYGVGGTSN